MINDKFKKFLAFEWLMLWILGFFWASAMFLPLFLTGSFDHKTGFLKSFFIMFGPYAAYLFVRSIFLIGKALIWSYLTSNFFFKDQKEKIFADEMFRFLVFGPVWGLIMSAPMYFSGYFRGGVPHFLVGILLGGPYIGYLVLKLLMAFFGSVKWAVQVTIKK